MCFLGRRIFARIIWFSSSLRWSSRIRGHHLLLMGQALCSVFLPKKIAHKIGKEGFQFFPSQRPNLGALSIGAKEYSLSVHDEQQVFQRLGDSVGEKV